MTEIKSYEEKLKSASIPIRDGVHCKVFSTLVDSLEEIYNLEIRPDDVWIVTYPKCGKKYSSAFTNYILAFSLLGNHVRYWKESN